MGFDIIRDDKLLELFWDDLFDNNPGFPADIFSLAKIWKRYITNKDIGLEFIKFESLEDIYRVVDERKWMLARIKYGI